MNAVRNALITGGAKGIGRAVAQSLAARGFGVVICYNESESEARALADELNRTGRALAVQADITDGEAVTRLKQRCDAFGGIDTLVNNAGVALVKLFQDVTDAEYDRVMQVNVKGAFSVTRAFLPDMISNRFGRIINISSVYGVAGGSTEVVYSMSKAALIGLTKALAQEVALSGVTVNAVAPGAIDTDMTAGLSPDDRRYTEQEIPMGRFGRPQEVAAVVAMLAEQSSYVTGQVINVTGGWLA